MCEPTTLLAASLAISATQLVTTTIAQGQQADAQEAYQTDLVKANNASTALQLSALRIEQSQARESSARETQKAKQANTRAKATAVVAAGEAGVQGNSVDALLSEYSSQLGQYKDAVTRQDQIRDASYEDQATAIVSGAKSQNLNINAPVGQAQLGANLLNFGSQALGAYAAYNPGAFKKAPSSAKKGP